MSEMKVDKLTGKTTPKEVTVTMGDTATQSLRDGMAVCYSRWNMTGTTATQKTLNIASFTDIAPGVSLHTFTSIHADSDYVLTTGVGELAGGGNRWAGWHGSSGRVSNASQTHISCGNSSFSLNDETVVAAAWHGDLA